MNKIFFFCAIAKLLIIVKSQFLFNIFDESNVDIAEVMDSYYTKPYFSVLNDTIKNVQSRIEIKGSNPQISNTTFFSNNLLIRDLEFLKNGEKLKEAKDYTLDLDINENMHPRSQYFDYNYTTDNEDFKCLLKGGGIQYTQSTYSNQLFYNLISFGQISFRLFTGNKGIRVKAYRDNKISFTTLDDWIRTMSSKYPSLYQSKAVVNTDNITFDKLILINQRNIWGASLVGVTKNEMYIWNITSNEISSSSNNELVYGINFWLKLTTNSTNFDGIHKVALHNGKIIIGFKGFGMKIFSPDSSSNVDNTVQTPKKVLNDRSFSLILNLLKNKTLNEIINLNETSVSTVNNLLNSTGVHGVHNFTIEHLNSFRDIISNITRIPKYYNSSITSNEIDSVLSAITRNTNLTLNQNYTSLVNSFEQFAKHVSEQSNTNTFIYTQKGELIPTIPSFEKLTVEVDVFNDKANSLGIIKEFRFSLVDFNINNHTIYVIQEAVGLRCFNLNDLNFESKLLIKNFYLSQITNLDHSLYDNDASFIGVLANTNKDNQYMFYELALTGNSFESEHNPFFNRI